jgi:hypothetical protein
VRPELRPAGGAGESDDAPFVEGKLEREYPGFAEQRDGESGEKLFSTSM